MKSEKHYFRGFMTHDTADTLYKLSVKYYMYILTEVISVFAEL